MLQERFQTLLLLILPINVALHPAIDTQRSCLRISYAERLTMRYPLHSRENSLRVPIFSPGNGSALGSRGGTAQHWAGAGHEVSVLTGFPNHPTGIVPPEWRSRFAASPIPKKLVE